MRKTVFGAIVSVAIALPGAALAQAKATRTADDYVCQLSGDCEGATEGEELATKAAPATKGFSMVKAKPTKAAPGTKGFRLAKDKPAAAASKAVRPATAAAARPSAAPSKAAPVKVAAVAAPQRAKMAAAKATGRGDLNLGFELGSAVLTAEARANAEQFAKALMSPSLAGKKVLIEGHTDRQGARDMNLELSQRRAQAVADFLQAQGVPADRLQVKGFGFDKPLPGRSASAGENRRVEAVLIS